MLGRGKRAIVLRDGDWLCCREMEKRAIVLRRRRVCCGEMEIVSVGEREESDCVERW